MKKYIAIGLIVLLIFVGLGCIGNKKNTQETDWSGADETFNSPLLKSIDNTGFSSHIGEMLSDLRKKYNGKIDKSP